MDTKNMPLKSRLPTFALANMRVLLRADLNVPMQNGIISGDHRLKQTLPTIDYIRKQGGKVILISHIGRPKQQEPELSTKHLLPWFENHGYPVTFANTFAAALEESKKNPERILLFENLRFFAGEKQNDSAFAQQLATLGDYYVNDAFGTIHRSDCSVTKVPELFKPDKRTIGFLMERELAAFANMLCAPQKPFVLIMGGSKAYDKIPLMDALLHSVDTILLGPALVFSFMHANGQQTGKSLVDQAAVAACRDIMSKAREYGKKIVFPVDYLIFKDKIGGKTAPVAADAIPENGIGMSIGPASLKQYTHEIMQANTVFFNGLMGMQEYPETLFGTRGILDAMQQSKGMTILGGGDVASVADQFGYSAHMSHCSTGGGAVLALLSGAPLPGIAWV